MANHTAVLGEENHGKTQAKCHYGACLLVENQYLPGSREEKYGKGNQCSDTNHCRAYQGKVGHRPEWRSVIAVAGLRFG